MHLDGYAGGEHIGVTTRPGDRRGLPETEMGKAPLLDDDEANWMRLVAWFGDRYTTDD